MKQGNRDERLIPEPHVLEMAQQTAGVIATLATSDAGAVCEDELTRVLRRGAQQMLTQAVETEAAAWIDTHAGLVDINGRRRVVRNGHLPRRSIQTGVGAIEVEQPRVHDRRPPATREKFSSKILPPYLRRTKSIEQLLPWLYLKGISTGDFGEALAALLGPDAGGVSAATITRLKSQWEQEQKTWSNRRLDGKQYVYVWADGIYFNIRLEDEENKRQCILVLIGATADGKKELIAIEEGYRESETSWLVMLRDLKSRGLSMDPKLAIADGALGFWSAARQMWPATREQRCWVHKTVNVLDKMSKSVCGTAKAMLHDIWMAATRAEAQKAFDRFVSVYEAKFPKATECLQKDRDVLLTFYDFPAQHWLHIRTSNPIESTFATVRLRHDKTKGSGSRSACLAMVFKLVENAALTWRVLNGSDLVPQVIAGVKFVDGERVAA